MKLPLQSLDNQGEGVRKRSSASASRLGIGAYLQEESDMSQHSLSVWDPERNCRAVLQGGAARVAIGAAGMAITGGTGASGGCK